MNTSFENDNIRLNPVTETSEFRVIREKAEKSHSNKWVLQTRDNSESPWRNMNMFRSDTGEVREAFFVTMTKLRRFLKKICIAYNIKQNNIDDILNHSLEES